MGVEDHRSRAERNRSEEARIHALFREGELERAAELAFRLYGDELMGWLVRRFGSRQIAAEMYSELCLYSWRYFAGFHWECTLRTWLYAIGRKVCYGEAPRLQEPLSSLPESLSCLVTHGRDRISTYKLEAVEDAYHVLCRSVLTEQEQDILTWRIYGALGWQEIARVLAGDPAPTNAALRKRAAALRKQFERIKRKLRAAAEERGLARRPE
jgi:RNA polymerase sigma-70 factor (ECF subfamily)